MGGPQEGRAQPELTGEEFLRHYRRAQFIGFMAGGVVGIASLGAWAVLTESAPPLLLGLAALALPLILPVIAGQNVNNRYKVPCPSCGADCVASFQRQVQDSGYYRFSCTECGMEFRGERRL